MGPTEDYGANCYLDLGGSPYGAEDEEGNWLKPQDSDSVTFHNSGCNYHSNAYYCQPIDMTLKPKAGSPTSCTCEKVEHEGEYSAELLIKCEKCLDVYKSTQQNSCPPGTKIFSPRSREDWRTFISVATPLREPHWIVDITRTTNGCGGCQHAAMNSGVPSQATWHTSDGSPWWLHETNTSQPDGDYEANCYMDLVGTPNTENAIMFDDDSCNVHSRSYYCQSVSTTTTTTTTLPAKCNTAYADTDCASGAMVDDPQTVSCTGNPCEKNEENNALCCQPKAKCSIYDASFCPSGVLVTNAAETECTDHACADSDAHDAVCCEAQTCAAHTCAVGSGKKADAPETVPHGGDAEPTCCIALTCSDHTCVAGNLMKSNVTDTLQGTDAESACCEAAPDAQAANESLA